MVRRILIVQWADIGDLVLSAPALSALRAAQPDAHLTLLTSAHCVPVIADTGLVDTIIALDRRGTRTLFAPATLQKLIGLRRDSYDAVLYFHHFTLRLGTLKFALIGLLSGARRRIGLDNGQGWFLNERLPDAGFGSKHQAQYWLDLVAQLGADSTARPAQVTQTTLPEIPELQHTNNTRRIVIHAGSGGYSLARRWSVDGFARVADRLVNAYSAQIILVGGPNDDSAAVAGAMQSPVLDLTGKTDLPQLAALLAEADLFIGADSGVMHMAAACGAPVVAIFGPSNHHAWGPWSPEGKTVVIRSAPECSPCSYVDHGIGLRDGCPARTCMRMVTAVQVFEAAAALLNGGYLPETRARRTPYRYTNRIQILGLPVDAITYAEWLDLIGGWVKADDGLHHVCTTNPEFMMVAQRDPNFRNILRRADLCVPDGVGLLWAARHLGQPLPERVTGSDGVPIIAERAAAEGWRLFFLGAAPGIADKAAQILIEKHPDLQIVGTYSGSPAPDKENRIVAMVNASGADILLVAYGAPEQDKWIARNQPRLKVKMAMGVGGSFDFIAGIIPRAPVWMRQAGLEWLYRLYLQPSRIGRMTRLPRFVLAVLRRGAD